MLKSPGIGSAISMMRIPLSAAFLILFEPNNQVSVWLTLFIAILAQLSDHVDGWVARKRSENSVEGWLFDSVSDRSFYIAAVLAFEREYAISDVVVWSFILREICLYATRISLGEFSKHFAKARLFALFHAALIRIAIVIGCVAPLMTLHPIEHPIVAITCNVLFSTSTIFGFLTLWLIVRK